MKNRRVIIVLIISMLGFLYAEESPAYTAASVETLAVTSQSWDGSPIGWYPYGCPQVTVLRITVPSGVKLALHKHPIPLVAYMISGELSVETEAGKKAVFQSGDPIIEVIDTWHFGSSTGEEDAVLVAFYMGVTRLPNTIEKE
ncbi:MAG: cupin domain-containing protein [Spirochaetia bacterium]|nr:cupin domain-containing protein [Spirochaetia bacterium]